MPANLGKGSMLSQELRIAFFLIGYLIGFISCAHSLRLAVCNPSLDRSWLFRIGCCGCTIKQFYLLEYRRKVVLIVGAFRLFRVQESLPITC